MTKITCGPENIQSFNQKMREVVPEFHALAKQLHSAGLIKGLAGATLDFTIVDIEPLEDRQPLPHEGKQCAECASWQRLDAASKSGYCLGTPGYICIKKAKNSACCRFVGVGVC